MTNLAALAPVVVVAIAVLGASLVFAAFAKAGGSLARRARSKAFANAAPPSIPGPTARIAFLGDVQRGIRDVAKPLAEAVTRERVDLLVSSGDLASHGEAPYYGVVATALDEAGLSVPMLVVPGNHDVQPGGVRDAAAGRRTFEDAVGPRRWTANVGRLLVAGVDHAVEPVAKADVDWLDDVVARHGGPWLLVCHKPPRRVEVEGAPLLPGSEHLGKVLDRRPPVAVVSGHLREDADATVGGVRYLVNVRGGDFEKKKWFAPPDFRLLIANVLPDGGVTFDWLTLLRRASWRTAWRQLCVRAWAESRRGVGRAIAAPGSLLLRPFSRRAV